MSPKYDFSCGNLFTQNLNHICFPETTITMIISVILIFHSSGVRLSGQVKETSRGHFNSAYSSIPHHHLLLFYVCVGIIYFLPLSSNLLSEKYYKNSLVLWGKYH